MAFSNVAPERRYIRIVNFTVLAPSPPPWAKKDRSGTQSGIENGIPTSSSLDDGGVDGSSVHSVRLRQTSEITSPRAIKVLVV